MKKILVWIIPLALLLSLCGCSLSYSVEPDIPHYRVVTQIDVVYKNGRIYTHRQYVNQEKMESILNYLRQIDPYGSPQEDPQEVSGGEFYILVAYSDGCKKLYRQKADRFLQADGGKWQKIDPDRARELSFLIGKMESDQAASADENGK